MKKISETTAAAVILLSALIVGANGYAAFKFLTADRGMVVTKKEKSNDNINVEMTRSEDWRQIASESLLSREQFAGIDGSTATIPITLELARQFGQVSDEEAEDYVSHNQTDRAYNNLIFQHKNTIYWERHTVDGLGAHDSYIVSHDEEVRLVFATPPSESEYRLAKENGVTLEIEPIALDGFVFITHKDNPVDSLTIDQVRKIYTGEITNWKEVGGKNEIIKAFQRAENSGSQTAMEELVMQGKPMKKAPITFVTMAMGELVDRVAEYENGSAAIGYTYYYYVNDLYKNPDIKVLKIDGVSPENESFVTGEYPFTTAYYAVIRSDEPKDSVYRELRDYMLTDEGQDIVEMAGYCPVTGWGDGNG